MHDNGPKIAHCLYLNREYIQLKAEMLKKLSSSEDKSHVSFGAEFAPSMMQWPGNLLRLQDIMTSKDTEIKPSNLFNITN